MKARVVAVTQGDSQSMEYRINDVLQQLEQNGQTFVSLTLESFSNSGVMAVILYTDSVYAEQGARIPAQPVQDKPVVAPRLNAEGKPE